MSPFVFYVKKKWPGLEQSKGAKMMTIFIFNFQDFRAAGTKH